MKTEERLLDLNEDEKKQIEKDVYDLIDIKDKDAPVILDLESIKIVKPGKYEIDLVHLFKGDPLIFKIADGKYIIDIAETFRQMRK